MPKTGRPRNAIDRSRPQLGLLPGLGAFIDADDFDVVDGVAKALGQSRAEIAREFLHQGIVAVRAAKAAEGHGADFDEINAAAIDAVRKAYADIDQAILLRLIDVMNDWLEMVERRRPQDAINMALGAATAFEGWADGRLYAALAEQEETAAGMDLDDVDEVNGKAS